MNSNTTTRVNRRPEEDEGVITLADKHFFPGLVLLYESIQNVYPVPVTCFDGGLSKKQKDWTKQHMPNCSIIAIPDSNETRCVIRNLGGLSENQTRESMLWICPFLIQNSPYQRVLWLDADLIVLRNLGTLFEYIDDGPVFTTENHAPEATANHPHLTHLLPLENPKNIDTPLINAGVSGWDIQRDADLIQAYIKPVMHACKNEKIRKAISWHDQGCLIWAVQNAGAQARVLSDTKWNLCAKHSAHTGTFSNSTRLNKQLQHAYPDACIVHWNGYTLNEKLFSQLGTEAEVLSSVLARQPGTHYASKTTASGQTTTHLISHINAATSSALINHFIEHYKHLGIDHFLIILHENETNAQHAKDLLSAHGITPVMHVKDYSASLKAKRVASVKGKHTAPDDWIVYADVDEFQTYPAGLIETLQDCDQHGYQIITGQFVDRLSQDGELIEICSQPSIWKQFPCRADIASEITGAWNRKICAAKSHIPLNYSGNHTGIYDCNSNREYKVSYMDPRNHLTNIDIHHFKWDATLRQRLENKLRGEGGDKDAIHGKQFIGEYHALYAHITENKRISVEHSTPPETSTS